MAGKCGGPIAIKSDKVDTTPSNGSGYNRLQWVEINFLEDAMKSGRIAMLSAYLLLLLPLGASAENSTKESGYTIHHNAFPTAILTPEIANNYQIVRSKYRGMLNVSVIKEQEGTTGTAVSAKIEAQATNLTGQISNIQLREIREESAIYYIADFPIVDNETLRFSLDVLPEGSDRHIKANLQQQFFID